MKWKKITVPIYGVEVYFCIGEDYAWVNRKIKALGFYIREKDKDDVSRLSSGAVIPLLMPGENNSYLYWMEKFKNNEDGADTSAHELTHVKNYIFQHIGIHNGIPSKLDELEAYLNGYLAREFFKFSRRK